MSKKVFKASIDVENHIDLYKFFLSQYSFLKVYTKEHKRPLSDTLALLLTIYMEHGYSKSSKEKAISFFNTSQHFLNSWNYSLKEQGYLVQNPYIKIDKKLSDDVISIKNYVDDMMKTGKPIPFLVNVSMES